MDKFHDIVDQYAQQIIDSLKTTKQVKLKADSVPEYDSLLFLAKRVSDLLNVTLLSNLDEYLIVISVVPISQLDTSQTTKYVTEDTYDFESEDVLSTLSDTQLLDLANWTFGTNKLTLTNRRKAEEKLVNHYEDEQTLQEVASLFTIYGDLDSLHVALLRGVAKRGKGDRKIELIESLMRPLNYGWTSANTEDMTLLMELITIIKPDDYITQLITRIDIARSLIGAGSEVTNYDKRLKRLFKTWEI